MKEDKHVLVPVDAFLKEGGKRIRPHRVWNVQEVQAAIDFNESIPGSDRSGSPVETCLNLADA